MEEKKSENPDQIFLDPTEKNSERQLNNDISQTKEDEEIKMKDTKPEVFSKKLSTENLMPNTDIKKFKYNLANECFVCKKTDDLFLCSRCRLVYYCNQECQKKDWKNHRDLCIPIDKQPNPENISLDHFKELKRIGEGNFSDIYSALNIFDKKTYAIKIINKAKLSRVRKEADIFMERHCLKKLLGSPYVIEIYSTFQDDLNLFIHFEYVPGGELWNEVKVFGLDSLSLVRYYFAQIISAVEYIHSKGIVHRDLKLENILLDQNKNVKLVDFGTAKDMFNPEIKGSGNSAKGKKVYENFVGTPNFMAPECVRDKSSDYRSDIWSLGCILFQLINGFPPFIGGSDYLIFQKSINDDPIFPEGVFSEDLKQMILWILKKEPEKRPTLNDIKSHEFFKGVDFNNLRDQFKIYEEQISKEEIFWRDAKKKVFDENIVLMKREELDKIMIVIREKIEKEELFNEEEKKVFLLKSQNIEKQLGHFYKLFDYEY